MAAASFTGAAALVYSHFLANMKKGKPHMNLADSRLKQLDNPSLTANERVLLRCRLASEFIHIGQYETAREALGELWRGVGARPEIERFKTPTAAEVLLQCGVLSSWLGHVRHISGAQEKAKDLLFEALRMFRSQRLRSKASEAQYELGMCYLWLGSYDEARIVLDKALKELGDKDTDLRAKILIRHTIVEVWTGRYHDAWNILKEAETFFEKCSNALKGKWHGQKGLVLRKLAVAERRADYADRAIIEFTAAIYQYELANHYGYCAINLNNLAMLLYQLGRYSEAHENIDHAVNIVTRLADDALLAQVNETRARVFVAEHRYREANRILSGVIESFQKGGEYALLADALTIQGVVWSRLGAVDSSIHILRQAVHVAQDSGSFSHAGLAALTLIEEHGEARLSEIELDSFYRRADEFLKDTQDAQEIARLRACACIVIKRLSGAKLSDKGFSLPATVKALQAKYIKQALEEEQGIVTRAAKRLGIGHQSLISLLKKKHKSLLKERTPPKKRKRSIIKKSKG